MVAQIHVVRNRCSDLERSGAVSEYKILKQGKWNPDLAAELQREKERAQQEAERQREQDERERQGEQRQR